MRRRLPRFPNQALQHLGLLIALVLIVSARGFAATRPALTALLVFIFSLPYLAASVVTRRAHFLYGTMLLGAVSYFLACYAVGAAAAAFPLLSVPLVSALLATGHGLRRRLDETLAAFPRTVFRAMHITVAVFAVWALWQAAETLAANTFLRFVPGLALCGFAAVYLVHGLAAGRAASEYAFSGFLITGSALLGTAAWSASLSWATTLAGAAVILFVGTALHGTRTYRWSRHLYYMAGAGLAVSLTLATVDWTFFLYDLALVSLVLWVAYGRLAAAVGDVRAAGMADRVVAKYLMFGSAAMGVPVLPLIFIQSTHASVAATALALGLIAAWMAARRRGARDAFNPYVLPAVLFGTAGLSGLAAQLPAGAGLGALVVVPAAVIVACAVLAARLDENRDRATRRALAASGVFPAFFGWYVLLTLGQETAALAAAVLVLAAVLVVARALRSPPSLYALGPSVGGVILAAVLLGLGEGRSAWGACAVAVAAAGAVAVAAGFRQQVYARGAGILAWLVLSVAALVLSTSGGALDVLLCATAVAVTAVAVAGHRGPSRGADVFDRVVQVMAVASIAAVVGAGGWRLEAGGWRLTGACLLALAGACAYGFGWSRRVGYTRAGAALGALGSILVIFGSVSRADVRVALVAVVAGALFGLASVARRRADVAAGLTVVGHGAALVAVWAALMAAGWTQAAGGWPLVWAAVPFLALYAAMPRLRSRPGFRFGTAAWASVACVLALVAWSGQPYREHAVPIAGLALFWVAVGFSLRRGRAAGWASPLYICATLLAVSSGLLGLSGAAGDRTWPVFLVNGVAFALLLVVTRQDLFAYLLTVTLALMAFDWTRASTSRFTQDVLFYLVIGAVVLGTFFLVPHLARLVQRLGTVPMFSIFTWRGAGLLAVPVAGLALLTLSAYSIKITEHPKFCTSCHYMGEYYDSWQHSSHKDVACISCHYEPGLSAELKGKVAGLVQLVKYVSHTYGDKPHALISNQSCMRVGCHAVMDHSAQTLLFRGKVKFSHEKHLSGHPRGKELNCVSCHGQVVEGQHLSVTETTCLTCHFHGRHDKPVAAGDCQTCHVVPAKPVNFMGHRFEHRKFLNHKTNVRCVDCHTQITEGEGTVSPTRCQSCHLKRTPEIKDQQQFHLVHVSAGHVDCLQCHDEIKHGNLTMKQQLLTSAQCSRCHSGGRHGVQEQIYAGTAVAGIEPMPDVMFKAGVSCNGCHTDVREFQVGGTTVTTRVSGARQCTECHHNDQDYGEMLTDWQADTKGRLAHIEPQIQRLETLTRGPNLPKDRVDRASQLLNTVRVSVSSVVHDGSYGAHNYAYVATILDLVEEQLEAVSTLLTEDETATRGPQTEDRP